jgi:hypothetical protein
MSLGKPFKEEEFNEFVIRTFSSDRDPFEMVWHFDNENRLVVILEETDWLFQFDNELPMKMKDPIFIPKGVIHRVIKGSSDLKVKIFKSND